MADVTVVVPTRDRPQQLRAAVESALAQSVEVDVVVVDDGSREPVRLPKAPRLRVVRHERSRGVSVARNTGTEAASTRWLVFLDDDDRLRPHMVEVSLQAVAQSRLPPPVGALSTLAVVRDGRVVALRTPPPARPRGDHFQLEPAPAGASYHSKQTLLVEREVMLSLGGFDPTFRSRVTTELFLRLNPVCSLVGVPEVTYELHEHSGPRISTDSRLRLDSFHQLEQAHPEAFAAHPAGHADLLMQHARTCAGAGLRSQAVLVVLRALRTAPVHLVRSRARFRARPFSPSRSTSTRAAPPAATDGRPG